MTCVYRSTQATIYRGDCLEIVPRLRREIDVVVTSPPYNTLGSRINRAGSGMMAGDKWCSKVADLGYADDWPDEESYQSWLRSAIRVLRQNTSGLVWINHKIRYRRGVAMHPARMFDDPIYSEVIWGKAGSFMMNSRRFANSHEHVFGLGRPHYWEDSSNKLMSVWRLPRVPANIRRHHPCPFPVDLAERLIRASCPPGGTVLDPFAGIGSVGVAALATGRRFVGIDQSDRYLSTAIERLKNWREEKTPAK